MMTNMQMKEMIRKMENILEQAIKIKEENKELKAKLEEKESEDVELNKNFEEFMIKVNSFGTPESRGL